MIRSFACLSALIVTAILFGCSPAATRHFSALSSDDVKQRREAAFQLSTLEPLEKEHLQILVDATYDKDPIVREYAFKTIGKMNPRWDGVTSAIKRGLQDPNISVRRTSAAIFSIMTPVPSEVLYTLALNLTDKDSLMRDFAQTTFIDLGQIGVNALMRTCKNGNDTLRCCAVNTLGTIGSPAKRALPTLKQLLNDKNSEVRSAAKKSISRIEVSYNPGIQK